MAESPITPTLLTADGKNALAQTWDIGDEGLELLLPLQETEELAANATLKLLPATDPNTEETLSAVLETETGSLDPTQSISRLTGDWGIERPLSCIDIQTGAPCMARIKIFSQGVWLPLTPTDIIATGSEQRFSPIMAGKIMIELIVADDKYPGVWTLKSTTVQALTLKAASLPADLSLAIADTPAFFRWNDLLPKAGIRVENFTNAVNGYLTGPNATRPICLKLRSRLAGKLGFDLSLNTVNVVKQLAVPADGRLQLIWKDWNKAEATAKIILKQKARLSSLSFNIVSEFCMESILGAITHTRLSQSQLCTPLAGMAQGFSLPQSPASALIGLDLPFQLRSDHLSASLALHPDLNGRPADTPYTNAVFPIEWPADADPRDPDGWLNVDFPHPIQLPDSVWWVVLSITDGEVLWPLADSPPNEANGCVYRKDEASWLPRSDRASVWALIRLRMSAPKLRPAISLSVSRGKQTVDLKADDQGRVKVNAKELDTLNQAQDSSLTIHGSTTCAGHLSLSQLRAAYR